MPKIIIICVLAFIVTLSGAAGISWYLQAHTMEKNIKEALDTVNKDIPYITYDAIESAGFPYEVRVSLVNPRFTGNINDLLKSYTTVAKDGVPTSPFDDMLEWNEVAQLDGKITIAINALSDRYSFTVSGNWRNTSTMDNKTISAFSQIQGDSSCVLQLARKGGIFGTLWNFDELASSYRDLSRDLSLLDCSFPAYAFYEYGNNKLLAAGKASRFYIQQTTDDKQRSLRLLTQAPEYYVTAEGDQFLSNYIRALDQEAPVLSNMAGYGAQSADVEFSYAGPLDPAANFTDTMDVNLSKLNVVNALFQHSTTLQYNNIRTEDQRNSKLALRSQTTASALYDVLLQRSARVVVHDIYTGKNEQLSNLKSVMAQYEEQGAYDVLKNAVPAISPLGTLTQALEGSYEGNLGGTQGNYSLSSFELSAAPYGLNATGNASMDGGTLLPKAKIALVCRNCIQMVDDAAAYATRLYTTLQKLDEMAAKPFAFTQAQIDGIKAVLLAISSTEGMEPGSLLFNIVSDGSPNITINGKGLGEVQALSNQLIPPLPQP